MEHLKKGRFAYRFIKRLFDIFLSFFLSLLTLPILLVAALSVMITDGGNPFFFHTRVGQHGKPLRVLKLRTMKKKAPELLVTLSEEQRREYETEYKLMDDPRLLGYRKAGDGKRCLGAFLRRTSIDELPQLWYNVLLLGNMSLVGPRPILKEELEKYYSKEEQSKLLALKPGITGYWQAYARGNATYENGKRQEMELHYAGRHGLLRDMKILLKTVLAVFSKAGAK